MCDELSKYSIDSIASTPFYGHVTFAMFLLALEARPYNVLLPTQGTCDASVNWGAKKDGSPLRTRASLLKARKDTWQHDSEDILKRWRTSKYQGGCYTSLDDMEYTVLPTIDDRSIVFN